MRGDPSVVRSLSSHSRMDVLLPQPVIAEVEYGLKRLSPSARRKRLRTRFDVFLKELVRAPWTDEVSRTFGRIKAQLESKGIRLEDFDVAVAAHAVALEATLVTDNLTHMKRIRGLELQNWRSGE